MNHAKGTFEVKIEPKEQYNAGDVDFGRFSVTKKFHGDLEGTSTVDMLTAVSKSGPRSYAALERVTGTLNGKQGSFVLLQRGTNIKDSQTLTVIVAPGLGTGALAGLEGEMKISIVGKEHHYEFEHWFAKK